LTDRFLPDIRVSLVVHRAVSLGVMSRNTGGAAGRYPAAPTEGRGQAVPKWIRNSIGDDPAEDRGSGLGASTAALALQETDQ
jgi:hypothetical protein